MSKPRIVIDTNVFLVILSRNSPHNWILKKLINQDFEICLTTSVLLEYEEIITRFMGLRAAEAVLGLLENLTNAHFIQTYFEFRLLSDADDNKFVDCAIAGGADFILTEDKDFKMLNNYDFPKVSIINIEGFKKLMP